MGQGAPLKRRAWLQLAGAGALAACTRGGPPAAPDLAGGWVGAAHERGHWLREALPAGPGTARRASVLVLGAGVAGLAAARGFLRAGVDDVHLIELEDQPGGNSRGHAIAGMACPLGAHYLPQPTGGAPEVDAWLHEIGLLRHEAGRSRADERHLCHSPQERLFFDGAWHDGLLPPADPASATMAQYRRFATLVAEAPRFTIPAHRSPWTDAHAALDRQTFADWLSAQGLHDAQLRWYLDYCCRDDYGAGLDSVSAWAGLHYFASRHGFHAPGDEEAPREPVLTWPEGNAWLARRLAEPLGERLHTGRSVLQARATRHAVELLAWDERRAQVEAWQAEQLILAVPLFVAARVLEQPPDALTQAAAEARYAPWLVANLHIREPLLQRIGVPPAWDNVVFDAERRSLSLGYVDAMHQSLRPDRAATILTAYRALPQSARPALLADDWRAWARQTAADLLPLHPDLPHKLARIDLMRHGHAMRIPLPGARSSAALQALRHLPGRVQLAHADLAGYSVFEEAFEAGGGG